MATILVVFLVWAPVAQAWSWPVAGPVLQPFSYDEAHPYDAGQHRGIDIGAAASGDPVVAPESGTVSFAGFVPTSGESLTIETADGYSVTLTHLGSIGVAEGAVVTEGDVVAAVGPSGTAEQSRPYVHLGVRLTADDLGYLDPLGLLPVLETPPPAPEPAPQPASKAAPGPTHTHGRGLVVEKPLIASPPVVAAPAGPRHARTPDPEQKPEPKQITEPAADTPHADARQVWRPVIEPVALGAPVAAEPLVPAFDGRSFTLSIAPGLVAALLALMTAFTRARRPSRCPATVIPLRREPLLRRAA